MTLDADDVALIEGLLEAALRKHGLASRPGYSRADLKRIADMTPQERRAWSRQNLREARAGGRS